MNFKTSSGAVLLEICVLERFEDLIELFSFGKTGVYLSFKNKESLRESGIKILGNHFESSYGGKSNSSTPVSTSSMLK